MEDLDLYNIVGLLGASLYLLSYLLLNTQKLSGDSLNYIAMNMAAAICVSISLLEYYNLPSLIIQLSWVVISIIGIYNCLSKNRQDEKLSR
ncbi:hypothetical protein [Vibrio sp. CAU 1672]|uniref:CBU_0592 family membrane protein n=1 Tax=Vibrio sp. CAU 1672 TaxID=3032594 RepID=UPI0023DB902F|nr:hypothetical protein [Vibrio sp. CAU 1672]